MTRFLFVLCTLFLGFLIDLLCHRYLAIYGIAPQILLLFVMSHGFAFGPLLGETLGFVWGLMADAMGVSLFGLQSFLLVFAGYMAGSLRRRVASERYQAQVVIALVATMLYGLGSNWLHSVFEGGPSRVSFLLLLLQLIMNGPVAAFVFFATDRWIDLWKVNRENL